MAKFPGQDNPTPRAVPRPRREHPTLSEIDLTASLPPPTNPASTPPTANEAEVLWRAYARLEEVQTAHAASFLAWRKLDEKRHADAAAEQRRADEERRISRIKAWATLVAAVGGLVAAVLGTLLALLR